MDPRVFYRVVKTVFHIFSLAICSRGRLVCAYNMHISSRTAVLINLTRPVMDPRVFYRVVKRSFTFLVLQICRRGPTTLQKLVAINRYRWAQEGHFKPTLIVFNRD